MKGRLAALRKQRLNHNRCMSARVWSLLAWALVAASAVFWGFKLWARSLPVPAHATVASTAVALRGDFTRVLGADPVAPPPAAAETPAPDARITLVGVVSPKSQRHAREGLALISIDGKPPKTYRVGAVVDGDRVLQAVSMRGASLGPVGGATQVSLNIAPPAEAARGRVGAEPVVVHSRHPGLPAPSIGGQAPAGTLPGVDAPPPTETFTPAPNRPSMR